MTLNIKTSYEHEANNNIQATAKELKIVKSNGTSGVSHYEALLESKLSYNLCCGV